MSDKTRQKLVSYSESKQYSDKNHSIPKTELPMGINMIIGSIGFLLFTLFLIIKVKKKIVIMCQVLCLMIYMYFYTSHQIDLDFINERTK